MTPFCLCPPEGLHHREHCCEREHCNLFLKAQTKLALDGVIIICLCTIVLTKNVTAFVRCKNPLSNKCFPFGKPFLS